MNLIMINGKMYNLDKFTLIRWNTNLELWENDQSQGPHIESGPEAEAAWEWLQKACIWKMEPIAKKQFTGWRISDDTKTLDVDESDRELLLEGLSMIDGEIYNQHGPAINRLMDVIKKL